MRNTLLLFGVFLGWFIPFTSLRTSLSVDQWAILHLAALVPLIFILSAISIRGERFPRWIFFVAAGLTLSGFVWSETPWRLRSNDAAVARFSGDDDSATRRFIGELTTPVRQLFVEIDTPSAAREFLNQHREIPILLTVQGQYLTISLSPGSTSSEKLPSGYELVTSIPHTGLSLTPKDGTMAFVNLFLEGFDAHRNRHNDDRLLAAAEVESPWRSFSHRALPLLLVATQGMITNALSMERAEGHFQQAAQYLRPNDNPELRGAVLNNLGVLRALGGEKAKAETTLRRAVETLKEKNIFGFNLRAGGIAGRNLKKLRSGR